MKTIKFSLLFLLFISLISCSEDESTPPNGNTSEMSGEWNLETIDYDGTTKMNASGTDFTFNFSGISTESNAVIEFNDNGTYSSQGAYTIALSMEGITYEVPIDMTSGSGNWSIEGDTMKFSEGFVTLSTGQELSSEPGEMIIDELTQNRMVLLFEQEDEINQNGFTNIVNVTGKYVLTR
ncbi:lipocalin family protein [Christiangramia sediminis]|uniref:Lipocalin family protein n=1 Tax=Christiangramia sediminis TaxID=2881336 RepID=A0A9X1LHM5_9FLAO|nr:lipocalin family protein [Christiangramia sediminis]MCB7480507.1 lipocalin family protein [Christiangramia sediminis]